MSQKFCKSCGLWKDFSEFHKAKKYKDGLQTKCKDCRKNHTQANKDSVAEYKKAYYEANKESITEKSKQYIEANKDVVAARNKAYYESNKDYLALKAKEYREANKESIALANKNYREANKDVTASKKKAYREVNKDYIKEWFKAYSQANKEHLRQLNKNWRESNKDVVIANRKAYKEANKESIRERNKLYHRSNKAKYYMHSSTRRAVKRNALPAWADTEKIKQIYKYAKMLSVMLDLKLHIDHCAPLKNEDVCGLHVVENLAIMTEENNLAKSNKFTPFVLSEGNPNELPKTPFVWNCPIED